MRRAGSALHATSSACYTIVCATGLESVELLMSKEIPGQNRGFCFLEFYNHACAQHAKAALSPPNFQCGSAERMSNLRRCPCMS